jgi:hypothetical protein
VLVLTTDDGRELAVCMSKVDAMMMSEQLRSLALEVKREQA